MEETNHSISDQEQSHHKAKLETSDRLEVVLEEPQAGMATCLTKSNRIVNMGLELAPQELKGLMHTLTDLTEVKVFHKISRITKNKSKASIKFLGLDQQELEK